MNAPTESAPASYGELDAAALEAALADLARPLSMSWRLHDTAHKPRVLIMVSEFGHCLNDLLFRAHSGGLNVETPAIVPNHPDLAGMADGYRIPFHHVPITSAPNVVRPASPASGTPLI